MIGSDMLQFSISAFTHAFNSKEEGLWMYNWMRGVDDRQVVPKGPPKQIMEAKALSKPVVTTDDIRNWISNLSKGLATRVLKDHTIYNRWPESLNIHFTSKTPEGGHKFSQFTRTCGSMPPFTKDLQNGAEGALITASAVTSRVMDCLLHKLPRLGANQNQFCVRRFALVARYKAPGIPLESSHQKSHHLQHFFAPKAKSEVYFTAQNTSDTEKNIKVAGARFPPSSAKTDRVQDKNRSRDGRSTAPTPSMFKGAPPPPTTTTTTMLTASKPNWTLSSPPLSLKKKRKHSPSHCLPYPRVARQDTKEGGTDSSQNINEHHASVEMLAQMGFAIQDAMRALQGTNGNAERAIEILLGGTSGDLGSHSISSNARACTAKAKTPRNAHKKKGGKPGVSNSRQTRLPFFKSSSEESH
jgi:hypothetical protein